MKATVIIEILGATGLIAAALVSLVQGQETAEPNQHTETKVSESREGGRYQRTTAVFQDKVLVTKTQEVSARDDGKINVVFRKLFRDGEMIYACTSYKAEKRTIRSYYLQGKMVMEEGDQDGDGFFETMILFGAKEQPVEAFSKNRDGTVTQFTSEKLAELRRSFSKFQE